MNCALCGQEEVVVRRLSRSYGSGSDLLVIENVPVLSCRSCGGSYLELDTAKAIADVRRRRSSAPERTVPVARLG